MISIPLITGLLQLYIIVDLPEKEVHLPHYFQYISNNTLNLSRPASHTYHHVQTYLITYQFYPPT